MTIQFSVAKKAGATVLTEIQKGYGYACLKGMEAYRITRYKTRHYCIS